MIWTIAILQRKAIGGWLIRLRKQFPDMFDGNEVGCLKVHPTEYLLMGNNPAQEVRINELLFGC